MSFKIKVSSPSFSKNAELCRRLLEHFPESVFNSTGVHLKGKDLACYFQGADAAIVGLEKIDSDLLSACPKLKVISKYGVGLDNINFADCKKHGVTVLHQQGVNKRSVAELTLSFMLMLSRNVFGSAVHMRSGIWDKAGGSDLSGKTVGIIGLGNIGRELIEILQPFHTKILGNDIVDMAAYCKEKNIIVASKEEIFQTADFITVHTPLTSQTHHLFNAAVFSKMKSSAFLINAARGPIVHQEDLKNALKLGRIAGAAVDVYEEEPPQDLEFLSLPNLIATAHIGGSSREAVLAMGMAAIENLQNYIAKELV